MCEILEIFQGVSLRLTCYQKIATFLKIQAIITFTGTTALFSANQLN